MIVRNFFMTCFGLLYGLATSFSSVQALFVYLLRFIVLNIFAHTVTKSKKYLTDFED